MATIMRKMNIISRCEAIYRHENSGDKLPGIYHSYILAICKNPGMPQEKLSKYLCVNKSSVTRHLAFLEKNNYIERIHSDSDHREQLVFPTEKMLNALNEVIDITKKWNSLLAEGISKEELELFNSVMDKMLDKSIKIIYGKEGDDK